MKTAYQHLFALCLSQGFKMRCNGYKTPLKEYILLNKSAKVYYIILLYYYKWYNIFQISIYLKFCLKKINCFQFIITDCEFCLVILLKDPWQTSIGCLRTTDTMLTVSWALLHFIIILSLLKHSLDRKQDLCVWSSEWSVGSETVTHLLVIFCHDAHIFGWSCIKGLLFDHLSV